MRIEDKSVVKASIDTVWNFLLDPQKLAACVPGVETVEDLGDNCYLACQQVKIGPISTTFNLKVVIAEMTPPTYLLATMEGKDTKTGSPMNAKVIINVESVSDTETVVNHALEIILSGVLGKFGEGILRKKADSVAEQFAHKLRSQLEG